jgi:hypothetical protein
MTTVKLDIREWADYLEELGQRFKPIVMLGIQSGTSRCVPLMQTRAMNAPPASTHGKPGAMDTGLYRAAWHSGPVRNGYRVYNMRPYAGVIDGGRRAKGVNKEGMRDLAAWAHRKLKLDEDAAKAAAWGIAKELSRRGLQPREVMSGGLDEMTKLVMEEVLTHLDVELGRGV